MRGLVMTRELDMTYEREKLLSQYVDYYSPMDVLNGIGIKRFHIELLHRLRARQCFNFQGRSSDFRSCINCVYLNHKAYPRGTCNIDKS